MEDSRAMSSGVLSRGTAILICIGFAVWVVFAWTHHAEFYAMAMDGWRVGGTHMVELTVVPEDRERLACASDRTFDGVRCGFDPAGREVEVALADRLSPFNTVKNQLFLGAGLWAELDGKGPLPPGRFSVVCNFHVLGAMRPSLRWQRDARFDAVKDAVATGRLRDCEIPK